MRPYMHTLTVAGPLGLALTLSLGCTGGEPTQHNDAFTPLPAVEITVDTDSIDFGSARADNDATVTRSVSITNNGSVDAMMGGVFVEGAFENYRVGDCTWDNEAGTPSDATLNESCGVALPANSSVSVDIVFQPTLQSEPEDCADRAATLTLAFNSSVTESHAITVTGIGDSDQDGDSNLCAADNDCDDTNNTIYVGAEELLDDEDNDCDGETDEGLSTNPPTAEPTSTAGASTPTAEPGTPTQAPGTPTADAATVAP